MSFKKLILAQLIAIFSISGIAVADFPEEFLTFRGIGEAFNKCLDAGYNGVKCERWVMPDGDTHDSALICECTKDSDGDDEVGTYSK